MTATAEEFILAVRCKFIILSWQSRKSCVNFKFTLKGSGHCMRLLSICKLFQLHYSSNWLSLKPHRILSYLIISPFYLRIWNHLNPLQCDNLYFKQNNHIYFRVSQTKGPQFHLFFPLNYCTELLNIVGTCTAQFCQDYCLFFHLVDAEFHGFELFHSWAWRIIASCISCKY